MEWNKHYDLMGKHAFLSGSNYHWTNYTVEKLEQVYRNQQLKEKGTALHAFASTAINERVKLAPLKKALNMFVNDAIGFGMKSEQELKYSYNCFGTADAIMFKNGKLRIHDLKTGQTKASFRQLDIYAALFCLEYNVDPHAIEIEQRVYQGRDYEVCEPDPSWIREVMGMIIEFDIVIDRLKYTE